MSWPPQCCSSENAPRPTLCRLASLEVFSETRPGEAADAGLGFWQIDETRSCRRPVETLSSSKGRADVKSGRPRISRASTIGAAATTGPHKCSAGKGSMQFSTPEPEVLTPPRCVPLPKCVVGDRGRRFRGARSLPIPEWACPFGGPFASLIRALSQAWSVISSTPQ